VALSQEKYDDSDPCIHPLRLYAAAGVKAEIEGHVDTD
jgi:hypothetical protein